MNLIDSKLTFPNGEKKDNTNPYRIVVHHIEAEGSNWTVQTIHNMHIKENGWNGIGYNYYIRLDGTIYTGRPPYMVGAHCQGANTGSIGVAFEGDYSKRTAMPDVQYEAFVELKAYLDNKYNKTFTIYGHKELSASECPGKNFPLDEIKSCASRLYTIGWHYNANNCKWWYCTNSQGWYYKDQWAKIDNIWYCFDTEGYVKENCWEKYNDKWCYLKTGGYAAQSEWIISSGKWYYFDSSTYMATSKWVKSATREVWYYVGADGVMLSSTWLEDKGIKYYLNSNGEMATNTIVDGIEIGADGAAIIK